MISLSRKYNPAMFLATASFGEKISVNTEIDLKFTIGDYKKFQKNQRFKTFVQINECGDNCTLKWRHEPTVLFSF